MRDMLAPMRRIEEVPPAVARFQAMAGVPDFVFFDVAAGTEAAARVAVGQALSILSGPPDLAVLARLPCRALTRAAFLGEWVAPGTGILRHRGPVTLSNGRKVTDPLYPKLEAWRQAGVTVQGSAFDIPGLWAGGEFAYAFAQPPYRLTATPGEVQAVFGAVCDLLLPPGEPCIILDWAGPDLVPLCPDYFESGTEWWGAFLWTVQVPARGTVAVVAASSTD